MVSVSQFSTEGLGLLLSVANNMKEMRRTDRTDATKSRQVLGAASPSCAPMLIRVA